MADEVVVVVVRGGAGRGVGRGGDEVWDGVVELGEGGNLVFAWRGGGVGWGMGQGGVGVWGGDGE